MCNTEWNIDHRWWSRKDVLLRRANNKKYIVLWSWGDADFLRKGCILLFKFAMYLTFFTSFPFQFYIQKSWSADSERNEWSEPINMIYDTQMESLNEHLLIIRSWNLKHLQNVNMIARKKKILKQKYLLSYKVPCTLSV